MKKYIGIIIFICLLSSALYSQENNDGLFDLRSGQTTRLNAVSIDFGTLIWDLSSGGFGIGASYERSIHEYFSVMGHVSYSNHDWNYFAIECHSRWYPFGTSLDKFFAMVNLGYGLFWNDDEDENWHVHTFKVSPKVGWKLLFHSGIFIEPIIGLGFPFELNENKSDLDISGGLGIGLNIGWAF